MARAASKKKSTVCVDKSEENLSGGWFFPCFLEVSLMCLKNRQISKSLKGNIKNLVNLYRADLHEQFVTGS
jgi:hypothetical protein